MLNTEEQNTLTLWARSGTSEQRPAKRGKVILGSAQGLSLAEISRQTGLSPQNCSKGLVRFLSPRLVRLKDQPRSGRPLSISPEVRLKVTALAFNRPVRQLGKESRPGPDLR